jgi:FkbM family methyltransferase
MQINGIKYLIKNREDVIQRYLLSNRQWNEGVYKFIIDIIEEKNLTHFLNIGSHIGTIALPVSKKIKRVSCVEAYKPTYDHLIENIKLNKINNIKSYNFAVGNSEEDIYFMGEDRICPIENKNRLKNNSGGMHVFTQYEIDNKIRSSVLSDKKIKNKMHKLDNTEIDDFDILLVDIEGCEYDFLLGAKEKIMKNKPVLIIEIWNNSKRKLENMTSTREEVIDLILSMGYTYKGSNGEDFLFLYLN